MIDHQFAKAGDKYEVFIGSMQWVTTERRYGSRWYNETRQLAALTLIGPGHYLSTGAMATTLNVPVEGSTYPPPGFAAMIGEELVPYNRSVTGFEQYFFTHIKSGAPKRSVFDLILKYC